MPGLVERRWLPGFGPGLEVAPVGNQRFIELVAVAILGVLGSEEVSCRADLSDRFNGECGVVDDDRLKRAGHHVEQVGVDRQLLIRRMKPTLHPTVAVHQEVDTAPDGPP